MDGKKIDIVREALIKLRDFAKGLDCDYQEECTPGEDDMCQSCKHVYIADQAISILSSIDLEAIRRECADKAVAFVDDNYNAFGEWDRVAFDDLRAAILADEPAQDDGRFKCDVCGNTETTPYSEGDACYCGGHFKPAQDDWKPEVATFDEMKHWLISKSGQYKSEYIQAAIVMLRNMFKERAAEVNRHLEEAKE